MTIAFVRGENKFFLMDEIIPVDSGREARGARVNYLWCT